MDLTSYFSCLLQKQMVTYTSPESTRISFVPFNMQTMTSFNIGLSFEG